jgi:DNA mismatch repair protein MutL
MALDDALGEDVPGVVALLDENTANRIAAGEVIERPSSVVKELVENALDAGATRIEVELQEGGKRRILVRDNGSGMNRYDAVLALQRHATSKIRTSDDLFSIHTLGFRGEALPSIASVSDFHLVTKRAADDTATEIVARGGDILRVGDAGAPDGTTIIVENLFFNTPARLKFLKTTQTELNQAVDLIHRLILAYHEISFRLIHDGYEMIAYPGAPDARHGLAAVWGRDVAREMVPLSYDSPGIAVSGFVSKPSVSRASRTAQATFVNGRVVRSKTVAHAFDSAFKNLMTTDRHPVLALFLTVAPELVDVNVHPAKTEVRFTRDGDVYSAVHRAVQNALLTGGLVPEVSVKASIPGGAPGSATPPRTALSSYAGTSIDLPAGSSRATSTQGDVDSAPREPLGPCRERSGSESVRDVATQATREFSLAVPGEAREAAAPTTYIGFDGYRIGRLRVLAQSRNTYIVAETDDAILLIDQHIAHERVLYEQMMNGAADRAESWGVVAQHLALPQTIDVGAREARIVEERLTALARSGFLIEPFGGDTFVVRAVPAAIAAKDYLGTLREIIEEMTAATLSRRLLVPHESAVIMASCKMAVKKGDPLTMDEMTRLLTDLARMRNPFTCPHGRPILLALTHHEMDRKFHRIGPH